MANILITGSTGNVGLEVIKSLKENHTQSIITAGLRDVNESKEKLAELASDYVKFDFNDSASFKPALLNIDILFLLRPPQIADVEKCFAPLIAEVKQSSVNHIVFLSVQGVEKSSIIPHHKIEKLIVKSGIAYTFLRPAYFMQNFTTTLRKDLVENKRIYLPAGNAKFTLIDVQDIGKVAAKVLIDIENHINKAYELTNYEKLSFKEMAQKLSLGLGISIKFISPNLISFFITKQKEKTPIKLIFVMIMLHYFPRFQAEPAISKWVEDLSGQTPTKFSEFVEVNKKSLKSI